MRRRFLRNILLSVVVLAALSSAIIAYHLHRNSDALWQIISRQCVPNQQQYQRPEPCQRVDLEKHYVLLKDRVGLLQYLLMPTDKITGIESSLLLTKHVPDYFSLAWSQLKILSQRFGSPIPTTSLSLTINSQYGRTQNQLHIHMSCLRVEVKQQLAEQQSKLTATWQPVQLLGHSYWMRTLTLDELHTLPLFKRIAQELPDINLGKGRAGVGLTQLPDGRLLAMVLRTDWTKGILGSAEEIQDHSCQVLLKNYRS